MVHDLHSPKCQCQNVHVYTCRKMWGDEQVRAIQSDIGTYSDEPEDAYEYGAWLMSFSINSRYPLSLSSYIQN
jgi:hypothetical protein